MIISGGENIASSEVERVVPQVQDARGDRRSGRYWGERPVAVVVVKAGRALALEALPAHCRRKLAGFKVPNAADHAHRLPHNPSGKVLKRVLREEISRDLQAPRAEARHELGWQAPRQSHPRG